MKSRIIIIMAISFLLGGCTTTSGTKVEPEKISQIKKGVTTQEEVIKLLGEPNVKSNSPQGETIFSYTYLKSKQRAANFIPVASMFASGIDGNLEALTVMIDKSGKVRNFQATKIKTSTNTSLINLEGPSKEEIVK